MSVTDDELLDLFPAWLRALGEDAVALGAVIAAGDGPEPARQTLAAGLNYLFKSLDLIPDGLDDVGYLDDAFVLRVAAAQAIAAGIAGAGGSVLGRLGAEAATIGAFLGDDYGRLDHYVRGLVRGSVRNRSVQDIVGDAPTQADFLADLRAFAASYRTPSFNREERTLVKLAAFFDAKLPR
ncbi:MAG: DUF1232 domain-containing protein [Myxococcales bacterium]|nr:DUF1232 domain-containing protein [Myxococcales bacterium]